MDKNYAVDAVRRFGRALARHGVTVQKMILFCSFAHGTQQEGSDIDVVVVSDSFAGMPHWDRIDILSAAICEVWEPIEATAFTQKEWETGTTTIHEYAKDGALISSEAE